MFTQLPSDPFKMTYNSKNTALAVPVRRETARRKANVSRRRWMMRVPVTVETPVMMQAGALSDRA